jgi:hypothetical protein
MSLSRGRGNRPRRSA